ncbi:MAG: ABC transporter permease [Magnetospirillum gryphiswaldense]|nr:ABC transporter permease [Magnetospirillum gryphiswaldense]
MNLALRDIRHRLGRFVLTCVGLALLLGVVLSMIGIYRGIVADALQLVRLADADLWVVEGGTQGPFAESSRIPKDARETVARLDGVAEAGVLTFQIAEASYQQRKIRLYVVGYEIGRLGGPVQLVAGRAIARAHYELVVDIRSGIPLGEQVRLGTKSFTVVGLTRGRVDSGGNPVAYLTLKDAQELQFELDGAAARNQAARGQGANLNQVNAVVARLHPGVAAESVAQTVRRWKHLGAITQQEQENLLVSSVVDRARKQIGMFTATLLLVSAVVIALIIYTMTMDKMREIATLKLIGAPDRTIIGLIVQQSLALGGIGFAFGAVLIFLGADFFPRRVILLPGDAAALGAVVIAVCLLASLMGVRYALKVDPAQALGG